MIPVNPDILDLSEEDLFVFPGNYRAIVEDNEDPIDIGRVRVRILGIHSLDPEETPVEHLPWAEPVLAMYYSGGKNLDCKESGDEKRYSGDGSTFTPPPRYTAELKQSFVDSVHKNEGTGGIFTVPRKGSMVWVFFENGDHTRPYYWACASKKADWESQRKKLIKEIKIKRENVEYWRKEFEKLEDKNIHKGKDTITANAVVRSTNEKPKLEIFNIQDIENFHITSYTSPGGVTHIIVNKKDEEKHYVIHKGHIEYTDHRGQRKIMVGNTGFKNEGDIGISNDFEHLIANNYELHVGGDFEIFVKKSKSVQIEGDMEINVKKQVGIVTREGNISIIVEKGDCNLDVKGNINIAATDNIQLHAGKNLVIRADNMTSLLTKKLIIASGQDSPGMSEPSFQFKDSPPTPKPSGSGAANNILNPLKNDLDTIYREVENPPPRPESAIIDTFLARFDDDVGMFIQTTKDFHFKCDGDLIAKIKYSLNFDCEKQVSFKCTQYSITCKPAGFHVDAGSKFRIDQAGFGGDRTCNAHVVNARHPGCFPGPIAGFSTPYPGTPIPTKPIRIINPINQKSAKETQVQDPNPPAVEEKQKGDSLPPASIPPPQSIKFFDLEF
ncbi:MAG: hypothetical protein NZZ41_01610 [Candidatus Dojkabacteria bacterium]|nr:hypothetical protein [Candidatus Dojkabacteria bacterium]